MSIVTTKKTRKHLRWIYLCKKSCGKNCSEPWIFQKNAAFKASITGISSAINAQNRNGWLTFGLDKNKNFKIPCSFLSNLLQATGKFLPSLLKVFALFVFLLLNIPRRQQLCSSCQDRLKSLFCRAPCSFQFYFSRIQHLFLAAWKVGSSCVRARSIRV